MSNRIEMCKLSIREDASCLAAEAHMKRSPQVLHMSSKGADPSLPFDHTTVASHLSNAETARWFSDGTKTDDTTTVATDNGKLCVRFHGLDNGAGTASSLAKQEMSAAAAPAQMRAFAGALISSKNARKSLLSGLGNRHPISGISLYELFEAVGDITIWLSPYEGDLSPRLIVSA
jgi:hypothetical protein